MKTNLIVFTILLLIYTVALAEDQKSSTDKASSNGLTVNPENLNCFKSLKCIQNEKLISNINFDIFRNGNGRYVGYTIEGFTKNEELFAQYNHRGNLISSYVIHRNIPLPRAIRIQLINDELNTWSMIGNERLIINFDNKSIEYKLILKKEDEIRILYFDHNGKNKNRLS